MRVFKTKPFARFAKQEGIADAALCEAVRRAEAGLIDADLGGGVIKQRLARPGGGKSGGLRSIVVFRRGAMAVRPDELRAFRKLAGEMLALDDAAVAAAARDGTIKEIAYHG
ncbi:MAG TPA: type II toxin-antitoxin system RelE/ParE family toxin [Stellaceae bacterium]|nr:type II toxin-antitoxin system RelE/ParE family toxin [Stellaceae bacterium]